MARIYIKKGIITYSVKSEPMSEGWMRISIKMVDERFPSFESALRVGENVREFANKVIDSWLK